MTSRCPGGSLPGRTLFSGRMTYGKSLSHLLCDVPIPSETFSALGSDEPQFCPCPTTRLGGGIARATVETLTASRRVTASDPRAGLNRSVMFATQPIFRFWNLKAQRATFRSVAGPPARPQDWTLVFLAQSFPGWRHLPRSVTVRASRIAVAGAPTVRPNRSAVDFAQGWFAWMVSADGYRFLHWHCSAIRAKDESKNIIIVSLSLRPIK